jgi:hypothetical protein
MGGRRTRYDLTVTYAITPAGDIDILDEGVYASDRYDSPTDALGDLGLFIQQNGGPDAWDETDPYEVVSCWLPDGEGTEVSYHAHLERVTETDDLGWAPHRTTRRLALLTWRRLGAANFGRLRRQPPPMDDHPRQGGVE